MVVGSRLHAERICLAIHPDLTGDPSVTKVSAVFNGLRVFSAAALLVFAGCRDGVLLTESIQDSISQRPAAFSISATEYAASEQAMRTDIDAIAIEQLGREIGRLMRQRGVSRAQLVEVKSSGDISAAVTLMGMSRVEMALLDSKMKAHLAALTERYPLIASLGAGVVRVTATGSIADCAVPVGLRDAQGGVAFFTACNEPANLRAGTLPKGASFSEEDGCDSWLQYIACTALCSALGPILYWPCAFLCLCEFCPSSLGCNI